MITSLGNLPFSEKLVEISRFLNVDAIGIETSQHNLPESPENIDVFSRLKIKESAGVTATTIKQLLGRNRKKYEYIVVEPVGNSVSAIAARDNSVDAIRITSNSSLSVFNKKYSNRLSENNKLVEIDLSIFYSKKIAKNLRSMQRIINTFRNADLKYSLFVNYTSLEQLRSYRGLQSLGRNLDIGNSESDKKHTLERIYLNRKKLIGKIPFPGVEIVDGS